MYRDLKPLRFSTSIIQSNRTFLAVGRKTQLKSLLLRRDKAEPTRKFKKKNEKTMRIMLYLLLKFTNREEQGDGKTSLAGRI